MADGIPLRQLRRRRHRLCQTSVGLCLLLAGAGASSMTLTEAFDAARAYDPQYRSEGYALDSARLSVPIARASLLPTLTLSSSVAETSGRRSFPNALNQEVTTYVDYASPQTTLALRAPLFNYESISRYRQAKEQTQGAEAAFRAKGLDLVDRLGTTYIQALLARTTLELAQTEVVSLQGQLTRSEQRLIRGEGTKTEEAQARASLDVARYRVLETRDQLDVAYAKLRRLTGRDPGALSAAPGDFRPLPIQPMQLQEWLDLAQDQNPSLEARRQAVAVARASVQRNLAGHLPRLDFVASLARSKNESLTNLNLSSTLKSVGLQFSLPLYSGGGVDASVRQAEFDQARVEQELQAERENIALEVQRLYLAVSNGISRSDALARVVASIEVTLQGVTRAREAGLATNADVLDAQSKLFSANRDLVQARYEYLAARMRLMVIAGMPMQRVVDDLDRILTVKTDILRSAQP